jgi:aldehyde dehydrogenase (NAD+)
MAVGPRAFLQLIGGTSVPASGGGTLESVEPATGRVWATIPDATAEDVDRSVAEARTAFIEWSALPAMVRGSHLRSVARMLRDHSAELAAIESRDNGRPLRETVSGDLPACAAMFDYFAGVCDKLTGDTVYIGSSSFNFTQREPIGVVGVIIPWNAPLSLLSAKVAAALAAGNTVVVKPAEQASCSVLHWASLLEATDLPLGVVNVVSGLGEVVGDALVRHPDVGRITFTGATETARLITAASARALKPLHFELGGKSPNIVFADADLDAAALGVSTQAVFTGGAGQTCIAGSRILVHESIIDELIESIALHARGVVLGDPLDQATTMGPIVDETQFDRVRGYLELGATEGEPVFGGRSGAELFPGGSPFAAGYFVEPTLFRVNGNDHRVCREEIFGPVAVVMPFATDDEAIALANDSNYGLAAGVWTTSLDRAHRMIRALQVGSVWVNTYRRIHWAMPFGGVKDSGYGRDSGVESVLENTRLKTAWIELS